MDRRSPARKAAGLLFASLLLWSAAAAAAPGDPLGPPFTVNTTPASNFLPLDVLATPGGYAALFAGTGLPASRLRHFDASGNTLGGELLLSPPVTTIASDMAMAADGRSVRVWHYYSGTVHEIRAQRYAADGSAVGPVLTVTEPGTVFSNQDLDWPRVAINAAGDFVVTWSQGKATGQGGPYCNGGFGGPRTCFGTWQSKILARRYTSGGTVPGATVTVDSASFTTLFVFDVGGNLGPEVDSPAVALADDGSYAVVWNSQIDAQGPVLFRNSSLKLRQYPASGAGRLARTVESSSVHRYSDVVADGTGNYVVAYRKHPFGDRNEASLWVRRYDGSTGNALGAAVRVDAGSATMRQEDLPDLAASGAGDFALAWSSRTGVHVQRYGGDGAALGGNLDVNIGGYSWDHAHLAKSASGFMVIWAQTPDMFTGSALLGRVYEGP